MLQLNYILEDAGWAILEISKGEELLKLNISYLHDSLKNLAESAIELETKNEKTVIFMDEPGEHWLILKKIRIMKLNTNYTGTKIGLLGI